MMVRVPVMVLPFGYYDILSQSQRAELGDMMTQAYVTGKCDDTRVWWEEVEKGSIEDGWAILIEGYDGDRIREGKSDGG